MTGILDQIELGWRFNPAEARNARGEWTRAGQGYTEPDTNRLSIPRPAHPSKPYYGHPRDHPFFQAHPVSSKNIVAAYDASSAQEREQGMRWYADAHDIAAKIADGDADKGAGVLAAYSPQTSWPVNMFNADRALDLGRALGPGDGMITGAMQAHAQKAMEGAPADVANTASKTQAFARLIRAGGDEPDDRLGQVVIDRHAMTVAMGTRLPKKEADFAPIDKDRYYQHVADQYRLAAIEISKRGTPIAPHQLQAITWLHQQTANQLEDEANHDRLARGRTTALRHAWEQWMKEAGNESIPTVSGTTGLAGGILDTIFDMAAWEHELRDSRGRWTRFGGVGAAVDVMSKNREGFSVSVLTGGEPAHGYMVAQLDHTHTYPETILDDHAKLTRAIDDMLMSERSAFEGRDTYLGGWVHDGKLWLEPSDNILDRATAEAEGRSRNQIAIWDVDNFEEIGTGGSGGGRITEHSNAQGAGQGPAGLLEQAGTGAPGYRLGDRGPDQGRSILSQLDLAAWEHEARGPHGEWVHGGGGFIKVNIDPDSGGWAHPVLNEATQVAIKNEIRKGMAAQEKYIPGIADKQVVNMVSHVPDADEDSPALGETMGDGTIFILPKITTALAGKAAAREAKRNQVDEGFWVPTDARYTISDQVLAHEMGHVVGEHLNKRNRYTLLRSEYWAPLAKAMGIQPPREGRTPGRIPFNNLAEWAWDNDYAIQEAVSVYGASSPQEMQGELWSEFTLSSHPRPPAVAFGKYALSHLPPEDLPKSAAYTQETLFSRAGLT